VHRSTAVRRKVEGGKSGQRRAACFLTGRGPLGNGWSTESAAERETARRKVGKDEKVR